MEDSALKPTFGLIPIPPEVDVWFVPNKPTLEQIKRPTHISTPNWLTRVLVQVENGDQLFWKKLEENTRHHVDCETFQITNSTNWSRIQQGTNVFIVLAFHMHEDLTFGMSSLSLSLSLSLICPSFSFWAKFCHLVHCFSKKLYSVHFLLFFPKKFDKNRLIFFERIAMFLHIVQASVINYNMWFWNKCSHF